MPTTKKIPVSFAPSYASEYFHAVNGTPKIFIQEPKPDSNQNNSNSDNNDTESLYPNRNKFGNTKQFLRALRPVVILGQVFGVVARGDVLDKHRSKSKVPFWAIIPACLSIFLLVNAILMLRLNILQFQQETDKTTLVRTEGFCHSGYAWIMFLVYTYQLFATSRLRNIIKSFIKANEWSYLSSHDIPGTKWFSHFPRDCAIIITLSLLLGITENVLYDVQRLARFTGNGMSYWDLIKTTNLEKYYTQTFLHWNQIMPSQNSAMTMIFVLIIKLCTWGWVYVDVISVVLCRALWEKLRLMNKSLAADLSVVVVKFKKGGSQEKAFIAGKNTKPLNTSKLLSRDFDDYQSEYLVISELVNQVQAYISPLILGNYMCNVYIIIVMLFHWIGPFSKTVQTREQSAYVAFALFYFCYRIGLVTYFVAEVHQMSISLKRQLQTCPNDLYSVAVDRLERTLVSDPAGIHLFGSFLITRHYFVSIIAFIFTSEIVLLQSYTGYNTPLQQRG